MSCCTCTHDTKDIDNREARREAAPMTRYARPRLFNWITILLVTAWVGIVAIIAESSKPDAGAALTTDAFVESLAR